MKKMTLAVATMATASLVLTACGGGDQGNAGTNVRASSAGDGDNGSTGSPTISAQPQDSAVITGASATFTVVADGSSPTYQWSRDGNAIAGATAASYTVPAVAYTDEGATFTVTVSNSSGSVTSSPAQLHLALSDDQRISGQGGPGGLHEILWNLNLGGAQTSGSDYVYTDYSVRNASPLTNGPQTEPQSAPVDLAASLALPTVAPRRILKNGVILIVPGSNMTSVVSFVGPSIRVDTLAADGKTVGFSQMRSNYALVPLTGAIGAAPDEFAHWFNTLFENPAVLDPSANFSDGAAYLKYDAVNIGDRYDAFDCHTATADANVNPCKTGTTLERLLTPGYASGSDGTTYHLADGTITTVGGVRIWVANATRPVSATLTASPRYRIYFEMGGSVYTGETIKDGARVGGSYWYSNPSATAFADRVTFLDYQVRLNAAARDSIAAALKL
jgi:hypothetical protein